MTPAAKRLLKQVFWPNGMLVLAATILVASRLFRPLVAAGSGYGSVAIIAAGLLIAWRFHAIRSIAGLLLFAFATFAFQYANPSNPSLAPALGLLLPLNIIALLLVEEFTLSLESLGYWTAFVAIQAAVIAMTCRPGTKSEFWSWATLPAIPLIAFGVVAGILIYKFIRDRRPLDAGLAWAALPACIACFSAGTQRTGYLAIAAVAITVSVVETSYQLAYEDELTRLPGRRAFNQTIAALDDEYSIAMVDVDHFKQFNDTYGHAVGDQVLRMVASRLADVSGDGRPFRCGGEEFAVVFPGKRAEEALAHVEELRKNIAGASFALRGPERSRRRREERRYCHSSRHLQKQRQGTSVTVSIGVAQPRAQNDDVRRVIEAADKALYAAKERGRNRVVIAAHGKRAAQRSS